MPTATSFTALGRGNGFPFCLNNVAALESAFSSNSDGAIDSIVLDRTSAVSLDDLMFFFWNLSELTTCTFVNSFTSGDGSSGTTTTNTGGSDIKEAQIPSGGSGLDLGNTLKSTQPRERVCLEESATDPRIFIQSLRQGSSSPLYTQGFYVTPSLTSGGDPCIAYALNSSLKNPRFADAIGTANGSEVSVNLPLNSSGATVAIKIVGIDSGGGNTSTAVSGNIVADFYTYS
jgi:hypothetical protein